MHWLRYALVVFLLLVPHLMRVDAQDGEENPQNSSTLRYNSPTLRQTAQPKASGGKRSQGFPSASSPASLAERLRQAYQSQDLKVYAELFTDNFRFYFSDPDLRRRYPRGWNRRDELAAARNLFEGFTRETGERMPPAKKIELDFEEVSILPNRVRLDSADYFQIVDIERVYLRVQTTEGTFYVPGDHHRIWVVRGDKAVLSDPKLRDARRWFIHKWVENPPSLPTADGSTELDSVAADSDSKTDLDLQAGSNIQPVVFGIHTVYPNPVTQPFELSFVLIGREVAFLQLFDVRGRQIWQRTVGQLGLGEHRVRYDGNRLMAGVYWVRLRQGTREDSQRITLLR